MKKCITAMILLLVFLLSACNQKSTDEMKTIDESSVYKVTEIEIPDDFNNNYTRLAIFVNDEKIYMLGTKSIDDVWIPVVIVYDLVSRTTATEEITTYNDGAFVDLIAFDTQKNQITIENVNGVFTLNKISPSGEKIFTVEISSDKKKILTDSDDNIYVAFTDSIESFDPNGKNLNSISFGGLTYNNFDILSNGKIYVHFFDSNYRDVYKYINDNKNSLSNPITKNIDMNTQMHAGDGYDVYYSDTISLYGYNESDNTMHTLTNWLDSGISYTDIRNVFYTSPEMIVYLYIDSFTRESSICFAEKTDEINTTEAKDITIVNLNNVFHLDTIALNFNKIQNDYNLILKSYATPDDWSAGAAKLNLDILAGDIPDIIIPDYFMPMMSYINKGLFADIYPFIDNDPDLSRDSFYDIIYSTYERDDGKLYQLLGDTSIYTLVTKETHINGKDSWTYKEFKDFYDSMPDDIIFSDDFTKWDLFYNLIDTSSDFVDYKNGTCDFDNELFIEIIETIKTFDEKSYQAKVLEEEEWVSYLLSLPELFKNDKIITSKTSISNFSDMIYILKRFNFEDITFMGYPSPYGDDTVVELYGTSFMITDQSKVKNGAWEFIKYYCSDEAQMAKMEYSIPMLKSAFKAIFENFQSYYLYFDKTGAFTNYNREFSEEELETNGFTFFELTDDHFNMMEKLLNIKNKQYSYDDTLAMIIQDELSTFFADGKTAEETAKLIQNRVSVYLSEIK